MIRILQPRSPDVHRGCACETDDERATRGLRANVHDLAGQPVGRSLRVTACFLALVAGHTSSCSIDRAPRPTVRAVGNERAPQNTAARPTGGEVTSGANRTATVSSRPSTADARPAPDSPTTADSPADELVADDAPLPTLPSDPPVEPALATRVAALVRTAERTSECWDSSMMERIAHSPDRRCPRWFAELSAGGVPAAHAIGQRLARDEGMMFAVRQHLLAILEATDKRIGAQYLVAAMGRALARTGPAPMDHASEPEHRMEQRRDLTMIVAFERLTGVPVRTNPPWASIDLSQDRSVRDAMIRALRVWNLTDGDPVRLRAVADARIRRWLQADDHRALHAAQIELDREGSDRGLVIAVLRRIERERTEAETRDFARQLLLRAEAPARRPLVGD